MESICLADSELHATVFVGTQGAANIRRRGCSTEQILKQEGEATKPFQKMHKSCWGKEKEATGGKMDKVNKVN